MLPRIESSDVMKRVMQKFAAHNEKCGLIEVIQKTKRGERKILRRSGLIPESITTSFHAILTDYVYQYNRSQMMVPDGIYSLKNLPALRTNSIRLSEYCRCTDRTVRNHISFLVEFGVLTKKFHGRQQDFELWINPSYLWPELIENEEGKKAAHTLESAFPLSERKNLPAHYTHLENLKLKTDNKEMCEKHIGFSDHGDNIQGQKGRTETDPETVTAASVKHGEGSSAAARPASRKEIVAENERKRLQKADLLMKEREAQFQANKPKLPNGNDGQPLDLKFAKMIAEFWIYALRVIYMNRTLSKEDQEKALIAIKAGVYGDFKEKRSDKQWIDYQVFQMEKLDKAARYFMKNPNSYAPDPFSRYTPGTGYFDLANLRGFVGVEKWMTADQKKRVYRQKASVIAKQKKMEAEFALAEVSRQQDIACDKLLRKARKDFEKLKKNEISEQETDIYGKNELGLFHHYNTIFSGISVKWQQKFCQQYLDQKATDFQRPKSFRQKRMRQLAGEPNVTIVNVEPWMSEFGEGYYVVD